LNHLSDAYSHAFLSSDDEEPTLKGEETPEEPMDVLRRCLEESKVSKIQAGHLTQYAEEKAKKVKQQHDLENSLKSLGIENDDVIRTSIKVKEYDSMIKLLFTTTMNESLRKRIAQNVREIYVPKSHQIISKNERSSDIMFIHQGAVTVTGGDHQEKIKHTLFNDRGFYFGEESDRNYIADTFCVIWAVDSRALTTNFESCFPSRS